MQINEQVVIEKLVNGGQGLATLQSGKRLFVWNALPGEKVQAEVYKNKKTYSDAIAVEIIEASQQRTEPKDPEYLATSPWQIMNFDYENKTKSLIIDDVFKSEKVKLPIFKFIAGNNQWQYRNKMEYSFWGDNAGLHLALHKRGSRNKQIVNGCSLAKTEIDQAASDLLKAINLTQIRAGDLKTMVVRCDNTGKSVASLFTKLEDFPKLQLPASIAGMRVYHSNPKSPASVRSKLIYQIGNVELQDKLLDKKFKYDVDSFFQVNIEVFEQALSKLKEHIDSEEVVDMYGGVGSIGLSVSKRAIIVDVDEASINMAKENMTSFDKAVLAYSEQSLDFIDQAKTLIVDPPRAGLHKKLTEAITKNGPKTVVYLSCNPVTQARDLKLLENFYKVKFFEGYNFFPKTPHIETLAILQRT